MKTICSASLLLLILAGCHGFGGVEGKKHGVYNRYHERDDLFSRTGDPLPEEWLSVVYETGQTLEEYRQTANNPRTAGRDTIYILPMEDLGTRVPWLLETTRRYVSVFFQTACVLLPPRSFPVEAYRSDRRQYDARVVLESMIDSLPGDALGMIAFTDHDLYHDDLQYVFGLASLTRRVGVYSIHRYGDPESQETLRRTLKVANHEIGHLLGIRHCIFYRCSMSGSNSLSESDLRPIHYCPVDLDKLIWAVGCDPDERSRGLAGFYRDIGFLDDARFMEAFLRE